MCEIFECDDDDSESSVFRVEADEKQGKKEKKREKRLASIRSRTIMRRPRKIYKKLIRNK